MTLFYVKQQGEKKGNHEFHFRFSLFTLSPKTVSYL